MAAQIDIFILMAGLGSRYRMEGHSVPKPLIKFKNRPLFSWALSSVKELLPHANLHLVICAEDNIQESVRLELAKLADLNFHTVHIISLHARTSGPLDSAVQAVRQTAGHGQNNPVIFCDCDLYLESAEWLQAVRNLIHNSSAADGLLVCFQSDKPKHSFVKTGANGLAIAVAEKKVISNYAIAGFYTFKESKLFLQAANRVLDGIAAIPNEHYISQVFDEMIASGKTIQVVKADRVIQLGTPEDLEASSKWLP